MCACAHSYGDTLQQNQDSTTVKVRFCSLFVVTSADAWQAKIHRYCTCCWSVKETEEIPTDNPQSPIIYLYCKQILLLLLGLILCCHVKSAHFHKCCHCPVLMCSQWCARQAKRTLRGWTARPTTLYSIHTSHQSTSLSIKDNFYLEGSNFQNIQQLKHSIDPSYLEHHFC